MPSPGTPAPSPYQFNVQVNADFIFDGQYKDSNGNPVPITNYKFACMMSLTTDNTKGVLCTTKNNRFLIMDATLGKFRILIPARDTQLFPFRSVIDPKTGDWIPNGSYNVLAKAPDGSVKEWMNGGVVVKPERSPIPE